jgi:two-component system response regulator AtoC
LRILIADDEKSLRIPLANELQEVGFQVASAASGEEAWDLFGKADYDLVISDLVMDKMSGMDLLALIKERRPACEVIIMTAFATVETAKEALKQGALDYICKPFDPESITHLIRSVRETIRLKQENRALKTRLKEFHPFHRIIGKSDAIQRVFEMMETVKNADSTLLLFGETGTGKSAIAEAIHQHGQRRKNPFISVSCSALSPLLIESELFGHEKGSFTGAVRDRKGRFELAHTGTLFLDDIDDIPLETQVKLLQFIQTGEFERVGGERSRLTDVRIIAATKRDLFELAEKGKFRRDLYYRLNVMQIYIPPLRERKEDIPLLVSHFLEKYSPDRPLAVSPEIMECLLQYDWDGNVRELEHAVERIVLLAQNGVVEKSALPGRILNFQPGNEYFKLGAIPLPDFFHNLEKRIITESLDKMMGNKAKTAELLGIPLPTLKSKIRQVANRD